jgi:Kef-type K+ transport system membrane component KefB
VLKRLHGTSAEIRVRAAFVLLIGMVVLAEKLGLELILGAFAAGAILNHLDMDKEMTHPEFRTKLAAAGFGIFIPVFFVSSGVRFDLDALFGSASTVAAVPLFLLALLIARGLPALLYRADFGRRRVMAAALLQATSLPFIVAATQIGQDLGVIDASASAAFIGAGLLSVLLFPITALALLRPTDPQRTAPSPPGAGAHP